MELEALNTQLRNAIAVTKDPHDQEVAKAMFILLTVLTVGLDPERIADETGCPASFVRTIVARMRQAGLWTDDVVDDREWWQSDGELAGIGLFRHALVALGEVIRLPTATGAMYVDAETAEIVAEWNNPDPIH